MSDGLVRNPALRRFARAVRRGAAALAVAALFVAGGPPARAGDDPAASDWFTTDQGMVRLVAASPESGGDNVRLGLEFRLAPGWKVYWRAPGDAGVPPAIDWAGSRNLADARWLWPAPQRFSAYGLETIGYEGTIVLPIIARLAQPGGALSLKAALTYLTCKEICIPYEGEIALDLPAGTGAAGGGHAALIDEWVRRVPGAEGAGGLRLAGLRLIPGKPARLALTIASDAPLAAPDAFLEGPPGIGFAAAKPLLFEDRRGARLDIPVFGPAADIAALAGHPLSVTVVDGGRAVIGAPIAQAPPVRDPALLLWMIGVALLGGLILNVMPCVLPVLSLKLLGVTMHAGGARRVIRGAFLATASGILAAFLALALLLIGLRAAGFAVGWGVQFQQPAFLVAMIVLLAIFACNLGGLFEFPLPAWLGGLAGGGERRGWAGDFAAGAFATVLATPCSAPFLGTAVGFALAGDALAILAIFLALGLGLALPYLAVAAVPGLAGWLPRPGRWMLTLRRALGVLLAGSALWLLTVLAAQTSPAAALIVLAALLALAATLRLVRAPLPRRAALAAGILVAVAAPLALPVPAATPADGGLWRRFDRAAIAALVGQGKTVFVDVTAEWCINCKVNERLVLAGGEVARRLAAPGTVAMRADWTRPSAAIADFLRGFDRYGIPFYVVYGPATPEGQPLSEILTAGAVLTALDTAATPGAAPGAAAGAIAPAGRGAPLEGG